jgi:hypothetical protein
VSPLLPPTSGNTHGRVVAKSCAPGPGARERTVSRSGGAGVAAHELRGAGAGGRGRGPGADDQPSGRRTFPSVLNARSPGMKPPRNSRLFVLPRHRFPETINRQDSITQAWTPEELAYAARVSDCVETTSASGAPDNSSLSHFSAMTRPSWLGVASMAWRTTRWFRTNAP